MPPVINVFIGQNHSGSWSATEAMGATLEAAQFLELEDHKFAPAAEFPPLRRQMEAACRLIAARPEPPRLVSSHVPLPLHIGLTGARIRYFTLLRHPVQRFVSCYSWLSLHKDRDLHWVPQIIRAGASLPEYAEHVLATSEYPGGLWPCEYFTQNWQSCGLVPQTLALELVAATFVLEKFFTVVGITELFDESLYVFYKQMGLPRLPRWRLRGNSGAPGAESLPAELRAKIQRLMAPEIWLYELYKAFFLERFQPELAEFRAMGQTLRIEGDKTSVTRLTEG